MKRFLISIMLISSVSVSGMEPQLDTETCEQAKECNLDSEQSDMNKQKKAEQDEPCKGEVKNSRNNNSNLRNLAEDCAGFFAVVCLGVLQYFHMLAHFPSTK